MERLWLGFCQSNVLIVSKVFVVDNRPSETIGDAYLGVAGLPGTDPVNGNSTLDMATHGRSHAIKMILNAFFGSGSILGSFSQSISN